MKKLTLFPLITLAILLITGYTSHVSAQQSDKTFQKGLIKEEGEGSLEEAIEIYNQVVEDATADRSLRAKALLHMGICYEKLGQEKARRTYQRLISDFADQGDIVVIGKKKLASLDAGIEKTASDDLTIRKVWSPGEDTYGVSPDGRYLNYIDWNAIELAVKDLKTGETWNITDRGTWEPPCEFPDNSLWSPDGKQIAYYWYTADGDSTEIRIANLDGSADRLVCMDATLPWPVDWSPDGQYLLAINMVKDADKPLGHYDQVALVSVEDGSTRIVRTFEDLHTNHMRFSPDGQYIALNLQQEIGSENHDILLMAADGSEEKWIVTDPGNDQNPIWTKDGTCILFLSDRLGTNDLWILKLDRGNPVGEPELVKSDLGERKRMRLLGITNDQSLFYEQSYARTDVFQAELDFTTGEISSKPTRISINDEIRNVNPVWSPDGRYIIYFTWSEFDYQAGQRYVFMIHDTQTGKSRRLSTNLYGVPHEPWTSPLWSDDGKSLLINGATKDLYRGFYLVDMDSGRETPVFVTKTEPRNSRSTGMYFTYSRDRKSIYYLTKDQTAILKLNLESKQAEEIFSTEERIASMGISPDESQIVLAMWLKDRNILYAMPTQGGELRKFAEFKEGERPYVISWMPDNEFVIVGKRTSGDPGSLEIMRVPADGGVPEHHVSSKDLFAKGYVSSIRVNQDGKHVLFAVSTGNDSGVWALENMLK